MAVWIWRAAVGDEVLAGVRADHVGDAAELADQIGTEVRCTLGRRTSSVVVTVTEAGDPRGSGPSPDQCS